MVSDAIVRSISEAKSYLRQISESTVVHTTSVVAFALKLARHYPEVDSRLVEVAAWWHDAGRLYNPDHEELSAHLADTSLRELGVDAVSREVVFEAIAFHKWSMSPRTIEGEIIRDADKLDFVSVSRWAALLVEERTDTLRAFGESLHSIRNELLHLEPSRPLFDATVRQLAEYLRRTRPADLGPVAELVSDFATQMVGDTNQ
jgi:hypothetical protein